MSDKFGKFGKFDWKCWKDEKPPIQAWIYIYYADIPDADIEIAQEHNVSFDEHTYWCYVFIPDAPKIERKMTMEDKIEKLTCLIDKILTRHERLLDRVSLLENKSKICNPFSDGG